jgi:hypothetical protein
MRLVAAIDAGPLARSSSRRPRCDARIPARAGFSACRTRRLIGPNTGAIWHANSPRTIDPVHRSERIDQLERSHGASPPPRWDWFHASGRYASTARQPWPPSVTRCCRRPRSLGPRIELIMRLRHQRAFRDEDIPRPSVHPRRVVGTGSASSSAVRLGLPDSLAVPRCHTPPGPGSRSSVRRPLRPAPVVAFHRETRCPHPSRLG